MVRVWVCFWLKGSWARRLRQSREDSTVRGWGTWRARWVHFWWMG